MSGNGGGLWCSEHLTYRMHLGKNDGVTSFLCPQPCSLRKAGKFSICIVNLAQGEKPSKQDSAALFLSLASSNPRLESSLFAEGHFCYSNKFFLMNLRTLFFLQCTVS